MRRGWLYYAAVSGTVSANGFQVVDERMVLSDHWPVAVEVVLPMTLPALPLKFGRQKLAWSQCGDDAIAAYCYDVFFNLSSVLVPWNAVCCAEPVVCAHSEELSWYCDSIVLVLRFNSGYTI